MTVLKKPGDAGSPECRRSAAGEATFTLTSSSVSEDLLSRPVVAAFLRAGRYERYASSLIHVLPQRRVRVPLREAFRSLRVEELGDADAAALNLLILERLKVVLDNAGPDDTGSAFRRAVADHPEGASLLGLAAMPTHAALKQTYRFAAMTHHPDRGGSHERMQALNSAFAAIEAALAQGRSGAEQGAGDGGSHLEREGKGKGRVIPEEEAPYQKALLEIGIRSWPAYRLGVNRLLFRLSASLCDLDGIRTHLPSLIADPAWARLILAWRRAEADSFNENTPDEKAFPRVARIPRTTPPLVGDVVDAHRILRLGKDFSTAKLIHDWIHDALPLHDTRDEYWTQSREAMGAPDPVRHRHRVKEPCVEEARHAFKFGLIERGELDRVLSIEEDRQRKRAERQGLCAEYVRATGFLKLPDEELAEVDSDEECLAPEPGYFADKDLNLTKEQFTEYLIAFQKVPVSVDLVEKWQFSRLGRLRLWKRKRRSLRTAIEGEARFFSRLFPEAAIYWHRLAGEK